MFDDYEEILIQTTIDIKNSITQSDEPDFMCAKCYQIFNNENDLNNHSQTHKPKALYECGDCGQCFDEKKSLVDHTLGHVRENRIKKDESNEIIMIEDLMDEDNLINDIELLECKYCIESFYSEADLQKHLLDHRAKKKYYCKECGKNFKVLNKLNCHLRTVHLGEKRYVCEECGERFKYSSSLRKHLIIRIGKKTVKCQDCGKGFHDIDLLRNHRVGHFREKIRTSTYGKAKLDEEEIENNLINDIKLFDCEYCTESFSSGASLLKHILVHKKEEKYSCKECGKVFKAYYHLRVHLENHAGEKKHKCNLCGMIFKSTSSLKMHLTLHIGQKKFECKDCGKGFHDIDLLENHTIGHLREKIRTSKNVTAKVNEKEIDNNSISDIEFFDCEYCNKSFSNEASLLKHLFVHKKKQKYYCKECGNCFKVSGRLIFHLENHTEEKNLKCNECGRCFKWESSLKNHLKFHTKEAKLKRQFKIPDSDAFMAGTEEQFSTHSLGHRHEKISEIKQPSVVTTNDSSDENDVKSGLECEFCCKTFEEEPDLEKHIQFHKEKKKFFCKICGKDFHLLHSHRRHQAIHAEKKKYECKECGKCFIWATSLKRHLEMHAKVKKYKCAICGNSFTLLFNLKRHCIKIHKVRKQDFAWVAPATETE